MIRDLLYALRGFRNSPTFTAVAIASLALGIGLNAAIFNLVSVILLQPLPVRDPARLFSVFTIDPSNPGYLYCSYPNFKDYRDRNSVFSGLTLFSTIGATLTGDNDPQDLAGQIVSGNYFDVLGVNAILGRTFAPEEDRIPGAHPVVVISYGFWTRRFGASRGVIGATIGLNNRPYTIIGVAPREFRGTNALVNTDFWVPMMMYQQIYPMADWVEHRKALIFPLAGRLKDGVSRQQAEANMKALAAQLEREYASDNPGRTVALVPLSDSVIQPDSRSGFVLVGSVALAASGLVLLIACANVANLLLVRAAGRRKEMALRIALGVGRTRLLRQLLAESALLSTAGAVAALLLARWTRDFLWTFRPPWMLPGDSHVSFDPRVLFFTLLLAVLATVVFGLTPAWSAPRLNLAAELRERRSPWTRAGHSVSPRTVLVMLQVALSVLALTEAGLFIRSLRYAHNIDPGFDAAHLATLSLDIKAHQFSAAAGNALYTRVLDRVRGLPGVAGAAFATDGPFLVPRARSFSVNGEVKGPQNAPAALIDAIDPMYFQTARIPLLRGRVFNDADTEAGPRVAIVNETMVRRYWSRANPIGARIQFYGDQAPVEVIGVVEDSAYLGLAEEPRVMVYLSLRQYYSPEVTLWVRAAGEPRSILSIVRREVQSLDRDILISDLQTAAQVIDESLWAPRLGAIFFASFGVLAGLLTVLGLYGVISYSVGQRTREIGIRTALGAQPRDVLWEVMAQGMILVAAGLALGMIASITITGVLSSLLYGVTPRDPLTLALVAAILTVTALAACAIPAFRATRIHPTIALHEE